MRIWGRRHGDAIQLVCRDGPLEIVGSDVLLAVCRQPNTDDLGLETTGIPQDSRCMIPVNERMETKVSGIWALGDCNGRGAFTHTSWNDYEFVAANLLDDGDRKVSDRVQGYAVNIGPHSAGRK
jgi:pyruvate/2-oxoglutarate dehydrogenase complex dihydrolipoamide dehydrogenase (E3) component